jgi:hypothetical protein
LLKAVARALRQRFFSGSIALGFEQLELTPQFGTALVDVIARFAALELGEEWICKISPGYPQQFLQPVYVAGQNFQLSHRRFAFEVNEAAWRR